MAQIYCYYQSSDPTNGKVHFSPRNQILGCSTLFNKHKWLLTLWGHAYWHKKSWVESPAVRVACQRVFFSPWLSHATTWVHTSPNVHHRVTMHIPHSKSVLTRITNTFLHAFFPSTTMPGHHFTPACWVVLTAWNGHFYGPVTSRVHDTTGTLSSGGVVCYQLRWKMIVHIKLERDMEATGIQNYGPHFIWKYWGSQHHHLDWNWGPLNAWHTWYLI